MWKKKNILSSSINGEANIRVGQYFLIVLPFHYENVEEEEYLYLFFMKLPLHPEHAEEEI